MGKNGESQPQSHLLPRRKLKGDLIPEEEGGITKKKKTKEGKRNPRALTTTSLTWGKGKGKSERHYGWDWGVPGQREKRKI